MSISGNKGGVFLALLCDQLMTHYSACSWTHDLTAKCGSLDLALILYQFYRENSKFLATVIDYMHARCTYKGICLLLAELLYIWIFLRHVSQAILPAMKVVHVHVCTEPFYVPNIFTWRSIGSRNKAYNVIVFFPFLSPQVLV